LGEKKKKKEKTTKNTDTQNLKS